MERNREGRRAGSAAGSGVQSATRRPRAKDASDDEDRMEDATESRAWERPKKERLTTFHVSASSNLRNKRKRQGLPQESQASVRTGVMAEDADESAEEPEIAASEDDDEPPPPPLLRKPGKSRVHAKEDEFVMDIPAVPRKARSSISSSSRFSSILRRQQESLLSDTPRQQSPVTTQTSLNGTSSPNFPQKLGRRLKPVGTKFQVMKAPKVSEPSTISDQEVEVAEALFVLARSTPSHAGVLESKFEAKLETEASPPAASPSSIAIPSISGPSPTSLHNSGVTTNGYVSPHVKDATGPVAEAPKRKRPRVVAKQEEGRVPTPVRLVASSAVSSSASPSKLIHFSVGETEPDPVLEKAHFVAADGLCLPSESLKGKAATYVPHSVSSQLHNGEEMKTGGLENQGAEHGEVKVPKQEIQSNADMGEQQSCRSDIVKSSLNVKHEGTEDISVENDGLAKGELPSRSLNVLLDKDGGISKLKIDLMASPTKLFSSEEDAPGLPTEKQSLGNDASIKVTGYNMEAPHGSVQEPLKHSLIMENAVKGLDADKGLLKPKERADGGKQELKQESEGQMHDHRQKEQIASQIVRGLKEGDGEKEKESAKVSSKSEKGDTDNAVASSFVPSTPSTAASSSAIPVPLAGWIPQLGYYGSGTTPWASLPGPNLDVKTAHPAMQLPHAAILSPVPRMKRCATHVYVAHFIHRELQMSRHTLWSAALCRATPYNLNIPPVNMLDNEKLGGAYVDATRKAPTQQSGPSYGYTISQSSGPGMTGSSGTLGIGATGTISAPSHPTGGGVAIETGTGTASGNAMAAHAQYLQAMMQQNGFASFSFPFNGPPGQAAQFFNSPFFPPHLMPPVPHLQPLAQQPANVLPVQKQQQVMGTLPHSITSQLVGPPPLQQQQLHLAPQSPSHSQQQPHNHIGTSAYHFGAHSEKESTVGGESLSTAESRLCAMQRSMFVQGPSNLPNLNISPSLMLATSTPALPSHDQDVSLVATSGGKQTGKSQQQVQFQGQDPASLSSSMQQHQFISQNTGSGPGLQMKALDQPLSQGYSAVAMSGANRGPVGPGPLGLVSVASMMATQGHGALPGSCENTKVYVQQQQGYGGHNQQYQRTIPKAASVSEDAYTTKGRDYSEDKKASMKQVGAPPHLSRVDMEASSPSFQGSPTNGSGASTARLTSNVGRTLNPATPPGARSSRSAPSVGAGQVPLLQNQPPKQAVGRTKAVSGTNVAPMTTAHTVSAYAERVLPGNLTKFPGTVPPFSGGTVPGQMAPSSQGSKPSHAGIVKVSQRMPPGPAQQQVPSSAMAKSQGQQARSNQPGIPSTPPRMLPSVSVPVLSSGTLSMSTSHSSSVPKAAVNKSPSNGKGTASLTKSGPPAKKPPVSGPAISSTVVIPGQNISVKAPTQQKSQTVQAVQHVPQFPQQHSSTPAQQQRVGTKNQVYPQLQPQQGQYKQSFQQQSPQRPQLFLQQHQQQYLQQSPSQQQQAVPQHLQLPVPHHYQQNHQNSSSQHGHAQQHLHHDPQLSHLQQQIQPSSSPPTSAAINNLSLSSPNLTLGTAISGNICSSASSDGADQFKGSGPRANPSKAAYSSGNPLPSGMPEMITTAHPAVSGQVSSPHSGSSHYLPLAPVKSVEHKPSSDGINREETNSVRHLPSSSPSQAAIASNSMSS